MTCLPLTSDDPRYPGFEAGYKDLSEAELPLTESLRETAARFMPLWTDVLAPAVKRWELLVIAAHGNSLRALVKYLDGIYDEEIVGLNIPTGVPLVYALNDDLKPIRNYNLGDEEEIRRAAQAVANQGKAG